MPSKRTTRRSKAAAAAAAAADAEEPSEQSQEETVGTDEEIKEPEGATEATPEKVEKEAREENTEEPPAKKPKTGEAEPSVEEKKDASAMDAAAEVEGDGDEKKADGENSPDDQKKNDEEEEKKEKKRPPELEKFWKAVKDDPSDFTGWTYLLQFVDTNGDLESGREAFDAFLFRYPYCYGYWKKYADFEKRKGDKCMEVFERGLAAIPLSADLWIHYLNHVKGEYVGKPEFVRSQFERSLTACGREWRSDKLWDGYVKWETKDQQNLKAVLKLYDRIIRNPTQGLSHQFEMFRDFVKDNNPKELLEVDDFLAMRKEVLESLSKQKAEGSEKKEGEEFKKEELAKKEAEDGAPGEDDSKLTTDEENQALREHIIFSRKKVFKETEDKVTARWKFEDNIKRPYFHMKPLERGQLKNWNDYLDHEIKEQDKEKGDESAIEILFERCLIACALYEEFWLKYVDWLKSCKASDDEKETKIRSVYERACKHHLQTKVDIHLRYSAFEETKSNFDRAAEILDKISLKHPDMLSLMLRRVNLERRRGNIAAVKRLYRDCISQAAKPTTKSDLSVKYARFLRLQLGEADTALSIVEEAIAIDEKNPKLYLQQLDILLHRRPIDEKSVAELFEKALKNVDAAKHKLLFSQRRVEFLEDFGTNISHLLEAQERHNKLAAELREANKTEEGADSSSAGAGAAAAANGEGIKTIEGRGKKPSGASPTTTSYPAANSASYGAHHHQQYHQYGSRYNASYGSYSGSGYNSYYGYGGSYGSGYSSGY